MGKRGPKKGEGGAPRKEIDWKKLDTLCGILCNEQEIAAILDMSIQALNEKIKEEKGKTFFEYYQEKSSDGKMSIRRKQFSVAMGLAEVIEDGEVKRKGVKPDTTMLIFLGKQYLGQKDQVSVEHSGSVDIPNMSPEDRKKRIAELEEELHGKRE